MIDPLRDPCDDADWYDRTEPGTEFADHEYDRFKDQNGEQN